MSRVLPRVPQRFVSDERLVALVRRGDSGAFESLYDRHVAELLSFCFFMLASREDAEDAVQSTFASAYRALLRDQRGVDARPWLFAIARNACIGILRKRRSQVLEETEQAARPAYEDVLDKVERRESVRQLLSGMLELPERHRSALILAELHGQSQSEIGRLLGVSPNTVKSYIFQARATLASERLARETACHEIREELADARGAALLKGRLRRHLRSCAGCREYAHHVSRRRHELGALLPLLPTLALKRRVLDATAGAGVTLSGAIELGGAGAKTLLAKVLIAAAGLGAGASAGTLVLGVASSQPVAPADRLALASATAPGSLAHSARGGEGVALSAGGGLGAGAPAASTAPADGAQARGQKASTAAHAHAQQGGRGGATGGSAGAGGESKGNGNGSGKANGNSSAHGNSATAHAGAKGRSAEHRHSAEHGNSGNHGHSGAHGNVGAKGNPAANGRAVGRNGSGASLRATAHGNPSAHGHASSPASGGTAGNAQGQGRSGAGASGGQPNGNGQAGAASQGSGAGAGGSSGAAPSSAQPPPHGPATEHGPQGPPGEAKPAAGGSAEHGTPGAGGHEPPGNPKA